MASDPQPAEGVTSNPGRRPGPTIDLKATELASEPVAGTEEPPQAPPPPEGAARPAKPPRARAGFGSILGAGVIGALLALVLFVGAAIVGRDQYVGDDTRTDGLASQVAGLELQVQELAARPAVAGTAEPAPAGVDAKAVEDLAARVAQLETAVTASTNAPRPADGPDPALVAHLAALDQTVKALDSAVKSLDDKVGGVAQRAESNAGAIAALTRDLAQATARPATPTVDAGEIGALGDALKGLDAALKALDDKVAAVAGRSDATAAALAEAKQSFETFEVVVGKRLNAEVADRATRIALMSAALNSAVDGGAPYAAELKALKALGSDGKGLAPLEAFAATGVPSAATLGNDLAALMPALQAAGAAPPAAGNFFDRLHANAEKLVRLSRSDEVAGTDLTATLARIEQRAAQSDVAGALAELAGLPDAVRAPAEAWIAKARARLAALSASRKLAADAVAALATAP